VGQLVHEAAGQAWRELSGRPCPAGPDRDRIQADAAARGWAPPLAWADDPGDGHGIDDPDGAPWPESWPWRPTTGPAALVEDLAWLTEDGDRVTVTRLSRSRDTVYQALHRAGRPDLWAMVTP
jgi:hypothetical protein